MGRVDSRSPADGITATEPGVERAGASAGPEGIVKLARRVNLLVIYDARLCVIALAHRSGPFWLLDRIAKEHRIEEAILTLLLDYYATDDYTESAFTHFVREYADVHGVRYELQNTSNIGHHKRNLGIQVLAEMPP